LIDQVGEAEVRPAVEWADDQKVEVEVDEVI
jgi:hypothetical protein